MLELISIDDAIRWDTIVRSFPNHDVYWLSGYVKAFKIHGDGEPLLFYYEDNQVRGINVVMKRDIARAAPFREILPEDYLFDFATPYGYGGWIISGDDPAGLFASYMNWARSHHIVSEFARFHPMLHNHNYCVNKYKVVQHGQVVHMDTSSPDIIWQNITSKN